VIAEPIQGEGGVRPLSPEFAAAIARVTKDTGTLLIADEIQCGLGRTGRPFFYQSFGWTPDLVTVGKAIGSGVPIGAALVAEHVAAQIFAGDHGTTYGGNLLSTRAALYVLEQLDALAPHIRDAGARFEQQLLGLQRKHAVVTAVRGAGLMRGLELSVDAQPVVAAALAAGLLVNRTAERVVRMLPPLVVTAADIDEATTILDGALASVAVAEVKA
jgi:acetylornithine/succinyldiaminopimelate/putrescine aminotransferase